MSSERQSGWSETDESTGGSVLLLGGEASPDGIVKECTICAAPCSGYHFNAPSCSACAAFFRRTVALNKAFVCAATGNCRVNYAMRVICRACRYAKCVACGMDRKAVQPRRDGNLGRRKIQQVQQQQQQQQHLMQHDLQSLQQNHHHHHHHHHHQQQQQQHEVVATALPQMTFGGGGGNNSDPLAIVMGTTGLATSSGASSSASSSSLSSSSSSSAAAAAAAAMYRPFGGGEQSYFGPWSGIAPLGPDLGNPQVVDAASALEELMRAERLQNERRKILYCERSIDSLLSANSQCDDIPYVSGDLRALTFSGIRRDIRAMILIVYDWLRSFSYFQNFTLSDRKVVLRRCTLFHTVLDPAYLTLRLGYPDNFVMPNGMFVGVANDSEIGWQDEPGIISGSLKRSLYRGLMLRVMNEVIEPMRALKLSFTEFVCLKALVSYKGTLSEVGWSARSILAAQQDALLAALAMYYEQMGLDNEEIAQRTGNIILLISSIFAVSMDVVESHHKIQFFDLWELDTLLLQLLKGSSFYDR